MHLVSASMTNFAAKSCLQDISAPQGPGLTISRNKEKLIWASLKELLKDIMHSYCIICTHIHSQSFLPSKMLCAQQKFFLLVKPFLT